MSNVSSLQNGDRNFRLSSHCPGLCSLSSLPRHVSQPTNFQTRIVLLLHPRVRGRIYPFPLVPHLRRRLWTSIFFQSFLLPYSFIRYWLTYIEFFDLAPLAVTWTLFSSYYYFNFLSLSLSLSRSPEISLPSSFYYSTIWVSRQGRRFLCLFWRETRQRILGPEISPYPEVVRGCEWELAGQRS